ncbi:MAG: hypothetical protein KBE23_23470 [Chloroflexi bacterium]|nr:hypothetical protein [Chloroflexota bacterium]MBP7045729.1 hypothetical protein [Chloroflexota bacterium]
MTTPNATNGSFFSEPATTGTNSFKPLPVCQSQSQKMEELGYLASSIAHDFNNLLTSIMGHASLALIKLPPDDDARAHIEQAVKTAEYAALLTAQLLSYSHQRFPEKELVNLNRIVADTITLLGAVLLHNVNVTLKLTPDLAPIEANPAQIQQIIMNLTLNAAEAIREPDGKIVIETGRITFSRSNLPVVVDDNLLAGDYTYFRITDSGKGMDEPTLARIFEPFFSTKSQGRGLGLSTILDIVRHHAGAIELKTEVGHGTCFTVYLPSSTSPIIYQPIH